MWQAGYISRFWLNTHFIDPEEREDALSGTKKTKPDNSIIQGSFC
jgi:hypothetical protein